MTADEAPRPAPSWRTAARRLSPTLALLAVTSWVCLRPLWLWLTSQPGVVVFGQSQAAGLVGIPACLVAAVLELRRARAGRHLRVVAALRLAAYLAVGHWLVFLLWFQPYDYHTLWATWTPFACLFALAVAAHPFVQTRLPPRLLRACDLVAFYLCVLVVGGDLVSRLAATIRPSVLLSRPVAGAEHRVAALRSPPGEVHFGFPLDSRGFYDAELAPERDRPLVVVVGDSFSQGVVPHHYHYTTVAERLLPGIHVYNAGIAGIDPLEYLQLLRFEVMPLEPDVVVVALFVGNDLTFDLPHLANPLLASWYDARNVLILELPRRLWAVRAGAEQAERTEVLSVQPGAGLVEQTPEALAAAMPWVADPLLERPTIYPQSYLELKLKIARRWTAQTDAQYLRRFEVLRQIAGACGDVPLLFLVIPDELQVDDAVWRNVVAAADQSRQPGRPLDRMRPQEVLLPWLDGLGVAYLDPLPALRAAPLLDDGLPHVYHLRDTHLNVRGNRIVGEVLARGVRPLVEASEP